MASVNGVKDNVHPEHYRTGKFECIDVMIAVFGVKYVQIWCIVNVFKYIFRHKNKNGLEDIKKAKYYLDKYLELEKEANGEIYK